MVSGSLSVGYVSKDILCVVLYALCCMFVGLWPVDEHREIHMQITNFFINMINMFALFELTRVCPKLHV